MPQAWQAFRYTWLLCFSRSLPAVVSMYIRLGFCHHTLGISSVAASSRGTGCEPGSSRRATRAPPAESPKHFILFWFHRDPYLKSVFDLVYTKSRSFRTPSALPLPSAAAISHLFCVSHKAYVGRAERSSLVLPYQRERVFPPE